MLQLGTSCIYRYHFRPLFHFQRLGFCTWPRDENIINSYEVAISFSSFEIIGNLPCHNLKIAASFNFLDYLIGFHLGSLAVRSYCLYRTTQTLKLSNYHNYFRRLMGHPINKKLLLSDKNTKSQDYGTLQDVRQINNQAA